MSALERIAEDKIRRAMQEGKFDHLPGRGKPLPLDADGLIPEEQRLAQHLLKNQGFLPDWLETWREIQAQRTALRRTFREAYRLAGGSAERDLLRANFAQQITTLNRQILGYNVRVPGRVFERPALDAEFEIRAALSADGDEE